MLQPLTGPTGLNEMEMNSVVTAEATQRENPPNRSPLHFGDIVSFQWCKAAITSISNEGSSSGSSVSYVYSQGSRLVRLCEIFIIVCVTDSILLLL